MSTFRDYKSASDRVKQHYKRLRTKQTVEYNLKIRKLLQEHASQQLDFWEVFHKLDTFVDNSDPDISLPNSIHCFQTAEELRKDGHPEWMQLVGLIHDMGKWIYALFDDEELGISKTHQWGCAGDTFVVGCQIPKECVYPEFNKLNPDSCEEKYSSTIGMYSKGCGLDNTMCSFGHDEYLYQILIKNKVDLPKEGLYMIRYHSLYPWHDKDCYKELESEQDKQMKGVVKLFNKYDLYTKENTTLDIKKLKPYYDGLVKKYLNKEGKLWW